MAELDGDTRAMWLLLRSAHSTFDSVAETLEAFIDDDTVSPEVYERFCEAVFTVLNAWAEGQAEVERLQSALRQIEATDLPHARRIDRDEMRQIAREALAGRQGDGA